MWLELSLRKQLEAANTGDVIITSQNRTGVYVAAKRAGFKVSTKEVDGNIQITVGEKIVHTPKPKISQFDSVLDIVKGWTVETRLKLFEEFELCCGMNHGSCICPAEDIFISPVLASQPVTIKVDSGQMNDAMARFMEKAGNAEPLPNHEPDEQWIDDGKTFENGEILYWHHKPKCKPVIYKRESDISGA